MERKPQNNEKKICTRNVHRRKQTHSKQFCARTHRQHNEGFSKTLKGLDAASPELIEVRIKRLSEPADVDAHVYPVK